MRHSTFQDGSVRSGYEIGLAESASDAPESNGV